MVSQVAAHNNIETSLVPRLPPALVHKRVSEEVPLTLRATAPPPALAAIDRAATTSGLRAQIAEIGAPIKRQNLRFQQTIARSQPPDRP